MIYEITASTITSGSVQFFAIFLQLYISIDKSTVYRLSLIRPPLELDRNSEVAVDCLGNAI